MIVASNTCRSPKKNNGREKRIDLYPESYPREERRCIWQEGKIADMYWSQYWQWNEISPLVLNKQEYVIIAPFEVVPDLREFHMNVRKRIRAILFCMHKTPASNPA